MTVFPIAIGSSFTAEPLRIPLQRWLTFLRREAELSFIPYGQMLLHLVDPNSPWFRNDKGLNVLLFRPSDLVRNKSDRSQLSTSVDEFFAKFQSACQQWQVPTLVILVSPEPDSTTPTMSVAEITPEQCITPEQWQQLELSVLKRFQAISRVNVISDKSIFEAFRCTTVNDSLAEQLAHIPWTDSAWLAVAAAITRFVDAKKRSSVKAIVVDCDNTLWHGVCGEDGPQGVRVDERHRLLQHKLLQQREMGRLICLCSKNSPEDVWSVFETHPDMLLRREHVTASKINWTQKSQNLLQLAKELNLGVDSFLFLDDNPLEISEVRAHLPEVISIALPSVQTDSWEQMLKHLWPLDGQTQTREDLQRAQMYAEETQRVSLRAQSQSLTDFLKSLELEVDIRPLDITDQARADQLLQRTNQFNIRPSIRSIDQLKSLSLDHELELHTIRTRDRFGDYGLVGLMISHCEGNTLHLDHLVLSCRALGRTIEIRMLQYLAELAEQRLKREIQVRFEASARNLPAYVFLCDASKTPKSASPQSTQFLLTTQFILSVDPIQFAASQTAVEESEAVIITSQATIPTSTLYQTITDLSTTEAIEKFQRKQFARNLERTDSVEYPATELERQICAICQDVLYYNELGLSDSFRDLGCSSLQFVRICSKLKQQFEIHVAVAETFALSTIRDLVRLVTKAIALQNMREATSSPTQSTFNRMQEESERAGPANMPDRNGHEMAIVGMAGRFPGADDIRKFWSNLVQGVESIETLAESELNLPEQSPLRTHPNLVRRASYIKNADEFDARFFGVFPKEAAAMDPQHRLLLEECYHALEDAGYIPDQIEDAVGVFAGCYMDTYVLSCLETHPEWIQGLANSFHGGDLLTELGNDKDYLATRISFLLNLRGPALTIQTACSTSLVAIIQACQSLQNEQCRMALAGGVTLKFPQKRGYLYTEGGMVSPEGKCRTFDANAKGTIFGEGVAVVALKKLEHALQDGDSIYAVLKGWGINNDGRSKAGYTAPSIAGQTEAITLAHKHARISADTIQYVEAHGTGTALGDPIEIEALTRAFRQSTNQKQFCRIGSAKTNIGHLDVAAGACGLIKASLSLQEEKIPPSLNFETPNPNIDFKNSPFIVNTQLSDWPRTSQPRRAGLSSFGVGGTNAHVIIEEAPNQVTAPSTHAYHLLNLSARSETSLIKIKQQLLEFLRHSPATSIADVCYTLSAGRKKFNHAWSTVVATTDDAIQALSDASVTNSQTFTNRRNVPVALAFPGQGSQHFDMGYELYKSEPIFAEAMDRCTAILLPLLKFNLLDAIFKSKGNDTETPVPDINQTIVAQPGIFAVSYATAIWLQSLGLTPAAMIGHSVGEFVAACLSGVFSLEDALRIVAHRAQSMQQVEPGNMLAVRLGEAEWLSSSSYRKYQSQVSLAAVNSPQLSVLSGRIEVIEALQKELELEGHTSKILKTSHAFHSSMMDCVVEPLAEQLKRIKLHKPLTKIVSTVTGKWLTDEEALSPDYWAKHLRETVRFSEAAETLLAGDFPIIIEAGPGQTVSTLLKQHKSNNSKTICSLFPHVQQSISHRQHALQTLGKVWQAGAEIQLAKLYHAENRYRVHLPGYPFERQRYWFDQLIQHPSQDLTTEKILESSVRVPNESVANMSENQRRESEYNDSHQSTHYARNDEYSLIVQQVIRQQLDIMTKQLKFWTQR